jgi:hypothetical protein
MITGSCLCGGVAFVVDGPLRPITACHCSQCRKQTGSYVAATQAPDDAVTFTSDQSLNWFASSDSAERGFCGTCGGNLFWRLKDSVALSIYAGAFDGPTGLSIASHIYVADKPDWYEIHDGKPQDPQWTP